MRHTRDQLVQDGAKAAAWAAAARSSGRVQDAEALERLADVCACAAARFASGGGFVKEDDAAAVLVRNGYFAGSRVCEDVSDLAECCPWTKCGICMGCPWTTRQWIFAGKRYECLTAWSCRRTGYPAETRQDRAGAPASCGGIIYRPQDIP